MSYDVAFWAEKPKCDYSAYTIYRRLRRGLAVKGLKPLSRKKALAAFKQIMTSEEESAECLDGHIGETSVEVRILDHGVLVDFRGLGEDTIDTVEKALAQLGLRSFHPALYKGDEEDPLYGLSYEEETNDPDPGYWVEVELDAAVLKRCQVKGSQAIGAQSVNGIDYVYFDTRKIDDASEIAKAINQGESFCPPKSLTFFGVDEQAKYSVVVCVPPKIVKPICCGKPARLQITVFTAFANDDEVLSYHYWSPDDGGECTALISLLSMPKRVKTILSSKFAFLG